MMIKLENNSIEIILSTLNGKIRYHSEMRRRVKIYLQEVHKHTYAPTIKFETNRIAYSVGKKSTKIRW